MADPALLELMRHLTWQPPAIVAPSPSHLSGSAMEQAYEAFIVENERAVAAWEERGRALRETLWQAARSENNWLDLQGTNEIIAAFDLHVRREARLVDKIKWQVQREHKRLHPSHLPTARRLHGRLIEIAENFYGGAKDFALFLRALRAERDPESRGGPSFDDADDLEAYLLSATT